MHPNPFLLLPSLAWAAPQTTSVGAMGSYDGPRVIEDLQGCSWSKCFYQMVGTFVIFAVVQVGEILYTRVKKAVVDKKSTKAHPDELLEEDFVGKLLATWIGTDYEPPT